MSDPTLGLVRLVAASNMSVGKSCEKLGPPDANSSDENSADTADPEQEWNNNNSLGEQAQQGKAIPAEPNTKKRPRESNGAPTKRTGRNRSHWKKYGEKVVKNVGPGSITVNRCYYRCNFPDCPVRKRIEKHIDANGKVSTTAKMSGTHTHSDEAFRDSKCFDEDGELEPFEMEQTRESGPGTGIDPIQQRAQLSALIGSVPPQHLMQMLQSGGTVKDDAAAPWQTQPAQHLPLPHLRSPVLEPTKAVTGNAQSTDEESLTLGMKLGMQLPPNLNQDVLMLGIKMGMQMPKSGMNDDALMMGMQMGMQMIMGQITAQMPAMQMSGHAAPSMMPTASGIGGLNHPRMHMNGHADRRMPESWVFEQGH